MRPPHSFQSLPGNLKCIGLGPSRPCLHFIEESASLMWVDMEQFSTLISFET